MKEEVNYDSNERLVVILKIVNDYNGIKDVYKIRIVFSFDLIGNFLYFLRKVNYDINLKVNLNLVNLIYSIENPISNVKVEVNLNGIYFLSYKKVIYLVDSIYVMVKDDYNIEVFFTTVSKIVNNDEENWGITKMDINYVILGVLLKDMKEHLIFLVVKVINNYI